MRPAAILLALLLAAACPAEDFPEPYDSEPPARGTPMSPAAAALAFELPEGFTATVLAAEPTVQNPIALAWDRRGRLWVAENYTYAEGGRRFDLALRDRVLIFEDTDRDGTLDRRTVFTDSVQMLTGIEVGHGGVWLMCPPRLLFIPDRDHDDVPDGPAETVLDGFEVSAGNYHNLANGLRFGPDGWLYGRCGHSCPARIGRPGAAADRRLPMEGGLWRYCVATGAVEVLTTGTTNPWGHDWTAEGEGFFVNTVNGHLWHLIPGAHFAQMNGIDPNPSTYELIDQHADHYHFDTGAGWQNSRDGRANALGGGHAHSGCMIYQGLDWPAEFRGRLFTLNFHGRRVNQEILVRAGSGYAARHAADLFATADPWFRGIELSSGPDGSVVVLDWSDTGECHERDGVHRGSGRIYRLAHGRPSRSAAVDLVALDDVALAAHQRHPDGWWAMHSRLLLAERAADRAIAPAAIAALQRQLEGQLEGRLENRAVAAADGTGVGRSALLVRALLTLHLVHGIDAAGLERLTTHDDEHVRTWAVRLLTEDWPLDAALGRVAADGQVSRRVEAEATLLAGTLTRLAADPSGLVRLAVASTLQRLPITHRAALAAALVANPGDATDHNLPLLVWYGLIPVAEARPTDLEQVAAACSWPVTRRLIARRLAELVSSAPEGIDRVLASAAATPDRSVRLGDILQGMSEGLAGWRSAPRPAAWADVVRVVKQMPAGAAQDRCRRLVGELAVVFGDGRAVAAVRAVALDPQAPIPVRGRALETLIEARPPDLREICEQLLGVRQLRVQAARGLAASDDPFVGQLLVEACRKTPSDKREPLVSVLVSRKAFVRELLAAIAKGTLTKADLTAFQVRQIRSLGDADLDAQVAAVWGHARETPADKRSRIEKLTAALSGPAGEGEDATGVRTPRADLCPDLGRGRLIYQRQCGGCHRLYGEGGRIGPDLTGAGRHDLGYLLENIVDPSAVVNRDWRMSLVELADGRVLGGVVVEDRPQAVTLESPTERLVLPRGEISSITPTDRSPMPEGLLDPLSPDEIRDLIGYLRHPTQVPLPAEGDGNRPTATRSGEGRGR